MSINGSALKVVKGWAVASLFRKPLNFIQRKKLMKHSGLILISLVASHAAFAAGGDLLAAQDSTVTDTFGHGSSLEKYFYYAEIIMALFAYIRSRSPMVFVGLVMVIIFTRIGFGLAG